MNFLIVFDFAYLSFTGFICQKKLRPTPVDPFVYMTPGVSIAVKGDALGQQYTTPEQVIGDNRSDVIIVGRSIIRAADPAATAEEYRAAGWKAFEQTLA